MLDSEKNQTSQVREKNRHGEKGRKADQIKFVRKRYVQIYVCYIFNKLNQL